MTPSDSPVSHCTPDPHTPEAPGRPGLRPTWTSSDKDAVTGALGGGRVRAAAGYGVINEVYWPSSGEPQVRDLTFIINTADGWIDVKRDCTYSLTPHQDGPLISIEHRLLSNPNFCFKLEIMPSVENDSLMINYDLSGGMLYALLAPHLADSGDDNTAWIQEGVLYAQHGDAALAFLADSDFGKTSVGFVGVSDGWQDFNQNGEMTWQYQRAEHGNVALMAELTQPRGTLALAFARHAAGAVIHARSSLQRPYALQREEFLATWQTWTSRLRLPSADDAETGRARLSAQVIRVHQGSDFAGAIIASLSVPFGQAHDSLGGYHLVWPRDMVEATTALLAVGQIHDAVRSLNYLLACQSPDGHWPQNLYPNGEPYWSGDQLDETAFVLILMAKLRDLEQDDNFTRCALEWAAQRAAGYLARRGPVSQEDRWEENSGVSAYTLSIMIAALVAATPWLTSEQAQTALAIADDWNARLEGWCYVTGDDAPLAAKYNVDGYYIRIAPQAAEQPGQQDVTIANTASVTVKAGELISLDFGYLVRMGLRSASDPRIQNSLKVVDGELRRETPSGPLYYRYQHDGYGNTADGGPFLGLNDGIGRPWPLLAGERGHLAVLSGGSADEYLDAMMQSSGNGGLFPEQVWDTAPIKLFQPGKPAGSAMPLVWAHAEFIKLLWARQHHQPYEALQAVRDRYLTGSPAPKVTFWTTNAPVTTLTKNLDLCIQDTHPFSLHFGYGEDWTDAQDREASEGVFGLWQVHFTAQELAGKAALHFTRRYGEQWEHRDWRVELPSA